ncbi:hypothetical protein N7462_001480 [Penicillium macrosclerotiorum]|uniref:uncharacterized protein n=1 Tax=Penicillium macrosclerotiorum TaxID=303699 RepID=UPI0025498365|nr:uncharacterized protein N7462_001480 [Penicillium macrosclerotiorum]KAJ5692057.1 hypothetical protein N7462_001480 [Penicillium macrosclerotiorum]
MDTSNAFEDISEIDETSFPYIFEKNVSIPLVTTPGLVRVNVYKPRGLHKFPVILTYGPYGKDISYKDWKLPSWNEINPEHKSAHSAWETPDPGYWTKHGYAVVRVDERGTNQSPGILDTMSRSISDAFVEVVEWAARQEWSNGKVGLLGVSYYAGSQWRVAARQPKGLAAIIPWEGMSDFYRDRCRQGGILSNVFIDFWWVKVGRNQYGKPGKGGEGTLTDEELAQNCRDQTQDNRTNQFRNQEYYASKEYDLKDVKVPLLSVGNWGGIVLHLRGNIQGFMQAGSELKYLRTVTGRHDLLFYSPEGVEIQRSFLHAFLKGEDRVGWSVKGKLPPVDLVLRKGDVGFNNPDAERQYPRRQENEWPIARTQYTKFYLTSDRLRKVNLESSKHLPYLPARDYFSTDVQPVIPGDIYAVDVEVLPTNVIIDKGGKLVFEVASGDTQGAGYHFHHDDPNDRSEAKFAGMNHINFGPKFSNYVVLPIIPPK